MTCLYLGFFFQWIGTRVVLARLRQKIGSYFFFYFTAAICMRGVTEAAGESNLLPEPDGQGGPVRLD